MPRPLSRLRITRAVDRRGGLRSGCPSVGSGVRRPQSANSCVRRPAWLTCGWSSADPAEDQEGPARMSITYAPLDQVGRTMRVKWYRSPIEPAVLRKLMQCDDLRGASQEVGQLTLAGGTGVLTYWLSTFVYWRMSWANGAAHVRQRAMIEPAPFAGGDRRRSAGGAHAVGHVAGDARHLEAPADRTRLPVRHAGPDARPRGRS